MLYLHSHKPIHLHAASNSVIDTVSITSPSLATLVAKLATQNQIIASIANHPISGQQLACDVAVNVQQLQQHGKENIGIYASCCYRFTVALFAAIHAKKSLVILPNLQLGFIDSLSTDIDQIFTDCENNSALPSLPISVFNNVDNNITNLPSVKASTVAISFFTSGSTGTPEKIKKTLQHIDAEIAVIENTWGTQLPASQFFATVTHQHLYGFIFRLLWPLSSGHFIDMNIYPYPELLLKKLSASKDPVLVSSPALLNRIDQMVDLVSLNNKLQKVFSSGGPLKANAAQIFQKHTGTNVEEIFGSTETGAIAYRQQCVHKGLSTPWLVLADTTVNTATDNQQLLVRSQHQAGTDWFKMGDTAELLENNRFVLKSRIDKIVKIEEKRVSLTQINLRLNAHPLIEESASLVIENRRRFIAVVAVLSPDGQKLLENQGKLAVNNTLREYLLDYFEAVVLPKKWRFVEQLPLNSQGKITRDQLLTLFENRPACIDKPTIRKINKTPHETVLTLFIPADLHYFNGHFNNKPVLPGVVQIDWAVFFGQQYFNISGKFNSMEAVKFHEFIGPDSEVELTLSYSADKNAIKGKLYFQYKSAQARHSAGRIVFI